jgi:hypothetical protein
MQRTEHQGTCTHCQPLGLETRTTSFAMLRLLARASPCRSGQLQSRCNADRSVPTGSAHRLHVRICQIMCPPTPDWRAVAQPRPACRHAMHAWHPGSQPHDKAQQVSDSQAATFHGMHVLRHFPSSRHVSAGQLPCVQSPVRHYLLPAICNCTSGAKTAYS